MWIFECRDPSYLAFKLGLAAVILLGLAHVIANVFGGCIFICSRDAFNKASANEQLAIACLIISWCVVTLIRRHLQLMSFCSNGFAKKKN